MNTSKWAVSVSWGAGSYYLTDDYKLTTDIWSSYTWDTREEAEGFITTAKELAKKYMEPSDTDNEIIEEIIEFVGSEV